MLKAGLKDLSGLISKKPTRSCVLQSVGKSSVTTAIVQFPYSPSGKGLTTKAPVRICLQPIPVGTPPTFSISFRGITVPVKDESEISPTVQSIMEEQIPAGKLTFDEVTVRVCKPGVPSLVFIDTPGIREDDPGSKALVERYLQSDNHLVVCLVEACYVSLASHSAVALVRTHGKGRNARLVLTKTDEVVTRDNIKDKVLMRILGQDEQMKEAGLSSAHAVITAVPEDEYEAPLGDFEQQHFQQHIFSKLPQLGHPFSESGKFIQEHCTMKHLVEDLVPWFESFVRKEGVPITQRWLAPKLQEAQDALTLLGCSVEDLTLSQVMEEVESRCDFQKVIDFLHQGSSNPAATGSPQGILSPNHPGHGRPASHGPI